MACVMSEEAPPLNTQIYETGAGCANDSECTTYAESKCLWQKLCRAGYVGNIVTTNTKTPKVAVDPDVK
ncbi:hypothetical protein OESDEN_19998 [Oesophagostomum dentatum]|uniref:Uncharacterized protein n=1 Tax=Oesophagostomum dentatum TaxID=61180 RepID=A0A0B1S4P8_OESDE|nr:hypothetical protein OESDEN_19998 [Oesophagostomum dentatum]